jgi:hypothetical protein
VQVQQWQRELDDLDLAAYGHQRNVPLDDRGMLPGTLAP